MIKNRIYSKSKGRILEKSKCSPLQFYFQNGMIQKNRTDVPVVSGIGQKGRDVMKEVYRKAIHEMIDSIKDEKVLKKIYSYILSKTKK